MVSSPAYWKPTEQDLERQLLLKRIFLKLYSRNKYRCLKYQKMPIMIACSALVNPEVEKQVSQSGFHGCISAPLKVSDIEAIIANHMEVFVKTYFM